MTIKGTIKQINQPNSFGKLVIRECVVTTQDKYPQDILVKFFNDKGALLDNFTVNREVEISFNLRGGQYNDKNGNTRYTTDVVGWKIDSLETSNADQQPDRDFSAFM